HEIVDPWRSLSSQLVGSSEKEPKCWRSGTELALRHTRDIHLEGAGQEKNAIDPCACRDVEMIECPVALLQPDDAVVEHGADVRGGAYSEREIDIGIPIVATLRGGPAPGVYGGAGLVSQVRYAHSPATRWAFISDR